MRRRTRSLLVITGALALVGLIAGGGSIKMPWAPKEASVAKPPRPSLYQTGIASWYGPGFKNRLMASMKRFNPEAMVAAHKSLPLGTLIRVRNIRNDSTVHLEVADRGPYARGRILDVSEAAARALGFTQQGLADVEITVVRPVIVAKNQESHP